jgi:GNAT superfamily N-acetyltransferase
MLGGVTDLATLETYYDTAPRANATAEEVGPFTLFVKRDPAGWDYYARPRLGEGSPVSRDDVDLLRDRQRGLGVPESIEWVHETTPGLLSAVRSSGLSVAECPLLVLSERLEVGTDADVRILGPGDDLAEVNDAVHAAFAGTDAVEHHDVSARRALLAGGLLAMAGAYDGQGAAVGGGSHAPRGATTELVGIGVLPRARRRGVGAALAAALAADARSRGAHTVFLSAQDDDVARVYERVGFVRVGTACIAEPTGTPS